MITLTASARCLASECPWTAAGGMAEVDKQAEKHTKAAGHPTGTAGVPVTTTGGQRP